MTSKGKAFCILMVGVVSARRRPAVGRPRQVNSSSPDDDDAGDIQRTASGDPTGRCQGVGQHRLRQGESSRRSRPQRSNPGGGLTRSSSIAPYPMDDPKLQKLREQPGQVQTRARRTVDRSSQLVAPYRRRQSGSPVMRSRSCGAALLGLSVDRDSGHRFRIDHRTSLEGLVTAGSVVRTDAR